MLLRRCAASLATGVTAVATSIVVAPAPVMAASASPASIVVDCGTPTGVTATAITGQIGDTFTVTNTSGTACTVASTTGIVSMTNLSGSSLPGSTVSAVTILAAGAFTLQASGGSAQPMTVVIGNPNPAPEYTITFDPNGGTCGSNAQSITAAATEWYALPTDGTGPYQCHRDYYVLTGWNHDETTVQAGAAEQAPDLPVAAPAVPATPRIPGTGTSPTQAGGSSQSSSSSAQISDHETLVAVWAPLGVEITYDANVAADDVCEDPSGTNLEVVDRSTEAEVYFAGTDDTLATSAPCAPLGADGQPLPLRGWSLAGDGPVAYAPGVDLTMTSFKHGSSPTLFAVWSTRPPLGRYFVGDDKVQFGYEVDTATQQLIVTIEMPNVPNIWVGMGFHNFMFPADSLVVSFNENEAGGSLLYSDSYNPGIPTLSFFPAPAPDDAPIFKVPGNNPYNNQENWTGQLTYEDADTRIVTLKRALITNDIFDTQFKINGQYNACAVYNLAQGYDMQNMFSEQPSHPWTGCGLMVME